MVHSSELNANNWLVVNRYDNFDPEAAPLYDIPDFGQTNIKGKLWFTAFRNKPGPYAQSPWGYKLYSYDPTGKVLSYWIKPPNGRYMKIENYYNLAGNLNCQILPDEDQRFYYLYDAQGRLETVKNGKAGLFKVTAVYSYTNDDKVSQ